MTAGSWAINISKYKTGYENKMALCPFQDSKLLKSQKLFSCCASSYELLHVSPSRWRICDFVNEVTGWVFPHIVVKLKCHCSGLTVEPPCVSGCLLTVNLSPVAQSLVVFTAWQLCHNWIVQFVSLQLVNLKGIEPCWWLFCFWREQVRNHVETFYTQISCKFPQSQQKHADRGVIHRLLTRAQGYIIVITSSLYQYTNFPSTVEQENF